MKRNETYLRHTLCLVLLLLGWPAVGVHAQHAGVKSNLLYDATATINLGAEVRLARRWTVEVSANLNPWTFSDNRKMRHLLVQPEFRWWPCRAFSGHFLGIHGHWARYNWGGMLPWGFRDGTLFGADGGPIATHRYQGWLAGAGITYGYQWLLSRHWNLEASIGVGYALLDYDAYPCYKCGRRIGSDREHYFGPTKAALSFIYLF